MNRSHLISCFLFIISCYLFGCKDTEKDDDQIFPRPTQTGRGIFATKVDGEIWKAMPCWGCAGVGSGIDATYGNGFFNIYGQMSDKHQEMEISLSGVFGTGEYILSSSDHVNSNTGTFVDASVRPYIYTSIDSPAGSVVITRLDTIAHIISGTFSFQGENPTLGRVSINEGRFDVKYK